MVSMEAIQLLMQHLQDQNANNMAQLARQQAEALQMIMLSVKPQNMMTDTRGVGKPINFKGEERKYPEWKAKLMAYLKVTVKDSGQWTIWASQNKDTITEDMIRDAFGVDSPAIIEFAVKLYATLLSCTEDDAFRICHSVKDGNGLEAMRLMVKRFEPRTLGTKRAILKSIINNPAAKKVEDVEQNLMHVEELMRKYENLARDTLPEDLKVTIIIDLCIRDLKAP